MKEIQNSAYNEQQQQKRVKLQKILYASRDKSYNKICSGRDFLILTNIVKLKLSALLKNLIFQKISKSHMCNSLLHNPQTHTLSHQYTQRPSTTINSRIRTQIFSISALYFGKGVVMCHMLDPMGTQTSGGKNGLANFLLLSYSYICDYKAL